MPACQLTSVTLQVRGGAVFTTLLLLVTALLAGRLTSMLHLPPLLGEVLLKLIVRFILTTRCKLFL